MTNESMENYSAFKDLISKAFQLFHLSYAQFAFIISANLGESCANGQTCIIQFSQCQGFPQTCQCQSNYIQVNNQCALSTGR